MPDYSEATEKLMKCHEVITKIDNMASMVALRRDAMDDAASALGFAEEAENPHQDTVDTLCNDLVDWNGSVKKHKKEYKKALKERALYEQAVEVFAPAGVRAHILDHVTPFLNARTGHYLSTLSDGNLSAVWTTLSKTAKGELREKFSIEVSNAKGGKSFGLLSGGEKRKVRLACAMALQDVVSQRATKPIDLFMADEIDDALDEAGLERLMAILDEKARERGTVLVVSHNSLSDWIREVATVTKEGGESTISGALT
jgi:DNA repair exonuclease SbcCD ATPase subunit